MSDTDPLQPLEESLQKLAETIGAACRESAKQQVAGFYASLYEYMQKNEHTDS